MYARVIAVAASASHKFSKQTAANITLVAGLGVAGDAHAGTTVKHRSRVAKDPTQPNLRQVHLMHAELFDDMAVRGFAVRPGDLGENITTRGLDLLSLSEGTVLRIGATAVLRVTGLRNPCRQIEGFQRGLLAETLETRRDGSVIRKAGVMAVVLTGGEVLPGDAIVTDPPQGEQRPLVCV